MRAIVLFVIFGSLGVTLADFRADALRVTNEHRAKHGSVPLKQDAEANKVAQAYAEKLAKSGKLQHSGNRKYGENLYFAFGGLKPKPTEADLSQHAVAAVNSWYGEVKEYDYKKPGFGMNTGHFTQLVWKKSTAQGIGMASNGKMMVVVANYLPPGNDMNDFPNNVVPVKSG